VPDQEAIEVAQADLADVSQNYGDPSESVTSDVEIVEEDTEQQQEPEEAATEDVADGDGERDTETKSQRRRRLRRERDEKRDAEIRRLQQENDRLRERSSKLKPPKREEFYDEPSYTAALAAYNVRAQDAEEAAERLTGEFNGVEESNQSSFQEDLSDFVSEGTGKYKDFAEKLNREPKDGGPEVTAIMAEALMETDNGIDVAYHLATHPAEANKIAKLPPVAQARAIWELEAKVTKPKEPAVSKAPPPVKPVRGGTASASKPVSEMSMSEYAAFRQRQMRGEA